jgi:hypothetical protein
VRREGTVLYRSIHVCKLAHELAKREREREREILIKLLSR